jgi:GT2 family glycosyltransferase/ubiquinone/menaquinone biosynthesis C-methylase UbiE/predicted  nucleic acid-binding Zn-ribbon protein
MEFSGERFIPNQTDKQMEIEHLQRYQSLLHVVKDKVVLDAATGEGYGAFLLSQSAKAVVGVDINEETIIHAQSKYSKDNLTFIQASIESIPLDDQSFDVIVSFETIEHVHEEIQRRFMKEVKRLLKPDGLFIISTPNKLMYSDRRNYSNPFHVKEFYEQEFRDFLIPYFKNMDLYYQQFEVASLLTAGNNVEHMALHKKAGTKAVEGMYFVAVCSDRELGSLEIGSVVPYEQKYDQMIQRILSLQEEVEQRNIHIKKLDEHIEHLGTAIRNRDYQIAQLESSLQGLNESIIQLNQELTGRLDTIGHLESQLMNRDDLIKKANEELEALQANALKLNQEIQMMNHELEEKERQLLNKQAHIEELLVQERALNNIYQSDGWKLLSNYYRVREKIIPPNSKRKLLAKLALKTLKNPKLMFRSFNKQNIKKLKYYLKTENVGNIEKRMETYIERQGRADEGTKIELIESNPGEKIIFPQFQEPIVSIIIPVYNQWHYTFACLKSILLNTKDVPYEVIVADDMSSDETVRITEFVENVIVVRDGTNRGFLLNCNNAATYSKGKYLFFLNNDTNVQADWLKPLVDLIENDDKIGIVGSKLVYPDGRMQEAGGIIWDDASGWNYGRLDDPDKPDYNYVKEVDYISGAAILIRTELWKQLGGFDTRYVPAYYEDTDLAFAVRNAGYKVVLQPKSVVIHFEGISHGINENQGTKSYQLVNKEKFKTKWQDMLKEQFPNGKHVFWARDRSSKKKTIVVVDHYVPHYDKDAGSRCTFHYLKLFAEMGMHVIFIGDNFYRHEPYTSTLQQLGIEVLYGNWYYHNIQEWIKNNGNYFDYVYLNRPHISIKYIDAFRQHSKAKIFYFGHDLHYLRELRNFEIDKNPELLKSSDEWKKIEFDLFSKADVIHTVGSFEQEVVSKEFPEKIVRNIPLYIFDKVKNNVEDLERRADLLFVGGFNHKPNLDGVKWFTQEVYPIVKKKLPHVKLYIVGSNPPDEIITLQKNDIIVTGFVSDEELERYYRNCRIVVVPLRFGAGVKGKVVEALYNQVPVVTTSIGAEGLPGIGDVVKISDQPDDFAANIIELYLNDESWTKCSTLSRDYINNHFSLTVARSILLKDMSL